MYQIPLTDVTNWRTLDGWNAPVSIDITCPMCRFPANFSAPDWGYHALRGMPRPIQCSRCQREVDLIRLGQETSGIRLYLDADRPSRQPLQGLDRVPDEVMPERLKVAYYSALNVLRIGEAEATAVTCRRALEGVTARLLAEAQGAKAKTLAQRLKALSEQQDILARPLLDLSDLLRRSGNLGAHYDDDAEPTTIEQADQMVTLLEWLLTYVYVIPQEIHAFRQSVLGDAPNGVATDETPVTPQ